MRSRQSCVHTRGHADCVTVLGVFVVSVFLSCRFLSVSAMTLYQHCSCTPAHVVRTRAHAVTIGSGRTDELRYLPFSFPLCPVVVLARPVP